MKAKDLTGQRFSRFKVLSKSPTKGSRNETMWICQCDCGTQRTVIHDKLLSGNNKSCGCLKSEKARLNGIIYGTTHGLSRHPVYQSWRSMIQRCTNQNHTFYESYGGRGIDIDPSWMSFDQFLKDMGNRMDGQTLDRIDNMKGYSKSNCRWADAKTQHRNRRDNRLATIHGATKTVAEWSEISGIANDTIWNRIKSGWSEDRLLQPSRNKRKSSAPAQQLELV